MRFRQQEGFYWFRIRGFLKNLMLLWDNSVSVLLKGVADGFLWT